MPIATRSYGEPLFDKEDEVRAEFLKNLDDADHINLSDWECEFIESTVGREVFTSRQRECIDRMRDKYRSRL